MQSQESITALKMALTSKQVKSFLTNQILMVASLVCVVYFAVSAPTAKKLRSGQSVVLKNC